jgi:hypothetical protein
MAKSQHIYVVQKGNEVPERFHGTEIPVTEYTSTREAIEAGHFENDEAVAAAAYAQRRIRQNIVTRATLADEDPMVATPAVAIERAEKVKYGAPRPASTGEPKRKGSGEIVKAKADAKQLEDGLTTLIREGKTREVANLVKYGVVTQARVDEITAKLATESVPA